MKKENKTEALLEEIRNIQKENQKILAQSLRNQEEALREQRVALARSQDMAGKSSKFLKNFFVVWIAAGILIFGLIVFLVIIFLSYLR